MLARNNPYRSAKIEALPFIFENSLKVNDLIKHFKTLNYRAAVTGQHGRGKTTLLLSLKAALVLKGFKVYYIRLNDHLNLTFFEIFRLCISLAPETVLIIDGAEQLSAVKWKTLLALSRRLKGFLVSSHAPCELQALYHCKSSPELLGKLLYKLNKKSFSEADLKQLYRYYKGNIREIFRALYDNSSKY